MNCGRCGQKLDEGAAFCGNCGQQVVLPPNQPMQAVISQAQNGPAQPIQATYLQPQPHPQPQPQPQQLNPQFQPIAPQPYYASPAGTAQTNNSLASTALVLGIIGFLTGLLYIGGVIGAGAIVTGSMSLKKHGSKGQAITGIVLGSFALLAMILLIVADIAKRP